MTQANCLQEETVARAAAAGPLPAVLAAHAAECPDCSKAAQVARWMQSLAARSDATYEAQQMLLPDAALVWRRATLDAGQAKTEKVRTALQYAQIAFAAAAPTGLAGWVVWNWYGIEAAAAQFLLSVSPQLIAAVPMATLTAATFALASLAPAALTLVALALGYPLLASE